jgi:acetoacetyl-CoA synthetase
MSEAPELLWEPSAERVERATLTRFARWLGDERGLSFDSYDDLWRWSVGAVDEFWSALAAFFHLRFSAGGDVVLGDRSMPGAEWFPGSRISYAEHVFRGKGDAEVAIRSASEVRPELAEWTWGRLRAETAQVAAGLRALGVGEGDRVVAYMPNIPETIACFLACASIGAVWSSAAPEFGARSVIDRFAQVRPKVLLAVDGYRYGGKDFDRSALVERIAGELPGLEKVVRLGYLDQTGWEEGFLGADDSDLSFAALPFDHPLWVLYSSGTTGLPKPIVHGQGGILVEQMKMGHLHLDAHAGDRVFWFSTTGWMMWNFLVGVLLTDASIVLFDGNPGYPSLDALWELAEEARITTFGTSAAFIASCMKAGVEPRAGGRRLSGLRAVGSTGSPLSPEGFRWVYDRLGEGTWLFSTSGGTDMCTAFVGGVPTLPVYLGELQARALGANVQAWDEEGRPRIDEVGELVITEPMPSMPIFFWGDDDGERLRDSYFSMYPGVWRHGDWIKITSRGTAVIYGRSDSTINRGGVRMGTAEIYRAVLDVDAVVDALVVDLPAGGLPPGPESARPDAERAGAGGGTDGWMPLFVVLRDGEELTDDLQAEIRRRIREDCSPRHVPNEIRQIAAVPRTLSGKVLEVPVKRILMGTPADQAASRESLANPESLDFFVDLSKTGE